MTVIQKKACPETERRILSWLVNNGNPNDLAIQKSMLAINESYFYGVYSKTIFRIIHSLYARRMHFDIVNLLDAIRTFPIDVFEYFQDFIVTGYTQHADDETIAMLVKTHQVREQLAVIEKVISDCQTEPLIDDCITLITSSLSKAGQLSLRKPQQGISAEQIATQYLAGYYKDIEFIHTGIVELDKVLGGGLEPKSLITIAGDSGIGKTYFGMYLMSKISSMTNNTQSLFFTLEMPAKKVWERLVSVIYNKPFANLTRNELLATKNHIQSTSVTFYEEQFSNIDEIETIARIKALEKPLSVIVVDYITLVTNSGKFERNDLRLADISKRLASLAMELNCTVIALSQVNRKAAERSKDDRCPYPSDAADSSGIVRSSTLWCGIDRPALYNDDIKHKNKFVVKCRKNRNGNCFNLVFDFVDGIFTELSHEKQQEYFQRKEQTLSFRDKILNKAWKDPMDYVITD
jgi:replicative DNA helicase